MRRPHRRSPRVPLLLSAALSFAALSCGDRDQLHPHDGDRGDGPGHRDGHGAGHDPEHGLGHGHDEGGLPGSTITHFATSADDGTETELFVEFGPLIVGEATPFAAHLTDAGALWTAIAEGSLVVELSDAAGATETFAAHAPSVPGIFRPVATPHAAGHRRLRFLLARGERTHAHDVGEVTVYPSKQAAEQALAQRGEPEEDDGAISFLKEQAWKLDFSLTKVTKRPFAQTLRVFGSLNPPSGGQAKVAAPAAGTVVAPKGGLKPVGSRVMRGETLAVLVPSIGGGGNLAAVLLRKEKAGLAVAHTERELLRLEGLLAQGAVSARRVHEAESELARARADLAGADSLLAQHQGAVTGGWAAGGVKVIAPIDGVITEVPVVAGAFVEEGGALASIVDTSVLLLTARIPEGDRDRARLIQGGAFRIGTGPWHPIPMQPTGYEPAPVLDPSDRTFPVRIPIANEAGDLPAGAHAVVDVAVGEPVETLTLDKRAVVFEQGVPVVFVMREGESFERLIVELGAEHAGWAAVKGGLVEGDRVATVGATYVKLASLGGGAPAHGHPH